MRTKAFNVAEVGLDLGTADPGSGVAGSRRRRCWNSLGTSDLLALKERQP